MHILFLATTVILSSSGNRCIFCIFGFNRLTSKTVSEGSGTDKNCIVFNLHFHLLYFCLLYPFIQFQAGWFRLIPLVFPFLTLFLWLEMSYVVGELLSWPPLSSPRLSSHFSSYCSTDVSLRLMLFHLHWFQMPPWYYSDLYRLWIFFSASHLYLSFIMRYNCCWFDYVSFQPTHHSPYG